MLAYTRPRRLLPRPRPRPRPSVSRPKPRPRRSVSRPKRDRGVWNFNRGETEPRHYAPRDGLETEASRPRPHPCYSVTVCSDIDECATNNGGCNENAICVNTIGSYYCYCKAGFAGNAVAHCQGKKWTVYIPVLLNKYVATTLKKRSCISVRPADVVLCWWHTDKNLVQETCTRNAQTHITILPEESYADDTQTRILYKKLVQETLKHI